MAAVETERDQDLIKVLNELADRNKRLTTEKDIKEYYDRVKAIYSEFDSCNSVKRYRHKYYLIFGIVVEYSKTTDKNVNVLIENINTLREYASTKDDEVKLSIEKLYDHINLDYARLDYMNTVQSDNLSKIKIAMSEVEAQKLAIDSIKKEYDQKFEEHVKTLEKTKEDFANEIKTQEIENKNASVTLLYTMIGTILSFSILAGSFEAIMNMPLVTQRVALVMANIAIVFITLYFIKVLNFDNTNEKIKKHLKYVIGVFLFLLLIVIGSMVVEYNVYGSKVEEYENTVEELNTKIQNLEERINDLNLVSINNTYEGDKGSLN